MSVRPTQPGVEAAGPAPAARAAEGGERSRDGRRRAWLLAFESALGLGRFGRGETAAGREERAPPRDATASPPAVIAPPSVNAVTAVSGVERPPPGGGVEPGTTSGAHDPASSALDGSGPSGRRTSTDGRHAPVPPRRLAAGGPCPVATAPVPGRAGPPDAPGKDASATMPMTAVEVRGGVPAGAAARAAAATEPAVAFAGAPRPLPQGMEGAPAGSAHLAEPRASAPEAAAPGRPGAEPGEPVRWHVEPSEGGLRVWLGADPDPTLPLDRLIEPILAELHRWAGARGTRLASLVCNGRTVWARAGDETDRLAAPAETFDGGASAGALPALPFIAGAPPEEIP